MMCDDAILILTSQYFMENNNIFCVVIGINSTFGCLSLGLTDNITPIKINNTNL